MLVPPAGRPHRLFNESGQTVREILFCAPAVFDRFVAAAGSPVDPFSAPRAATDEERRRLVEVAPAFGIRLLRSAAPQGMAEQRDKCASDPWDVVGTRVEVLARLDAGDDDLVSMRRRIEPGRAIPLHSRPDPESVIVVDGTLEIYREAEGWRTLGPRRGVACHAWPPHARRDADDRAVRLPPVSTVPIARVLAAVGSPGTDASAPLPDPAEHAAFSSLAAAFGDRRCGCRPRRGTGGRCLAGLRTDGVARRRPPGRGEIPQISLDPAAMPALYDLEEQPLEGVSPGSGAPLPERHPLDLRGVDRQEGCQGAAPSPRKRADHLDHQGLLRGLFTRKQFQRDGRRDHDRRRGRSKASSTWTLRRCASRQVKWVARSATNVMTPTPAPRTISAGPFRGPNGVTRRRSG